MGKSTKRKKGKAAGAVKGGAKPGARSEPTTALADKAKASDPGVRIAKALQSADLELAADLLTVHGKRILLDGDRDALAAWFEVLPDAAFQTRPRLAVVHAWIHVYTERFQEAATRLSEAERAIRALEMAGYTRFIEDDSGASLDGESFPELRRDIAAIRGHVSWMRGDVTTLPASADEVIPVASADHPVWRARALVTLGRCRFLAGTMVEAAADLESAVLCAQTSGQTNARVITLVAQVMLGRVQEHLCRPDLAADLYDKTLAAVGDLDHPRARDLEAAAAIGLGRVAWWRGDTQGARAAVAPYEEAIAASSHMSVGLNGLLLLSWLDAAQGDREAAVRRVNAAEAFLKQTGRPWATARIGMERAIVDVATGHIKGANRWVQSLQMRGTDALAPVRELQQLTHALVMLAQDDPAGALVALGDAPSLAVEAGRKLLALRLGVVQALALFRTGKKDRARVAMRSALDLAELDGGPGLKHPFTVGLLGVGAGDRGIDELMALAAPAPPPKVVTPPAKSAAPAMAAKSAAPPAKTAKTAAPAKTAKTASPAKTAKASSSPAKTAKAPSSPAAPATPATPEGTP